MRSDTPYSKGGGGGLFYRTSAPSRTLPMVRTARRIRPSCPTRGVPAHRFLSPRLVSGVVLLISLLAALPTHAAFGKVFFSRKEALKSAFPDANTVEPRDLFLTDEQAEAIEKKARSPLNGHLVTVYEGRKGEQLLGRAFFDTRVVRTQPQTLLVVLTPEGRVQRTLVCAFYEPQDYLPTGRWVRTFEGKDSSSPLRVGRDVVAVAGVTLTSRAVSAGIRKALAIHNVCFGK